MALQNLHPRFKSGRRLQIFLGISHCLFFVLTIERLIVAAAQPREMWYAMVGQVTATEDPNVELLCGFLGGLQKIAKDLAGSLLDEAVFDTTLSDYLPVLQAFVVLDVSGASRLLRALDYGKAPLHRFRILASGRASDPIDGPDLKRLVLGIAEKPDGLSVAVHILAMRLHSDQSDGRHSAPEVKEAGRALLAKYQFSRHDAERTRDDYDLGRIAVVSLPDDVGKPIVRRLCRDLVDAVA
jgi:hypothetical protein